MFYGKEKYRRSCEATDPRRHQETMAKFGVGINTNFYVPQSTGELILERQLLTVLSIVIDDILEIGSLTRTANERQIRLNFATRLSWVYGWGQGSFESVWRSHMAWDLNVLSSSDSLVSCPWATTHSIRCLLVFIRCMYSCICIEAHMGKIGSKSQGQDLTWSIREFCAYLIPLNHRSKRSWKRLLSGEEVTNDIIKIGKNVKIACRLCTCWVSQTIYFSPDPLQYIIHRPLVFGHLLGTTVVCAMSLIRGAVKCEPQIRHGTNKCWV